MSPSTWRTLGLLTAAAFTGLGLYGFVAPDSAAGILVAPQHVAGAKPLLPAVAARDLTISAALFAFDYYGQPESMGALILSTMILCVVDLHMVWNEKGPKAAFQLAPPVIGAGIVGWGLWNGGKL